MDVNVAHEGNVACRWRKSTGDGVEWEASESSVSGVEKYALRVGIGEFAAAKVVIEYGVEWQVNSEVIHEVVGSDAYFLRLHTPQVQSVTKGRTGASVRAYQHHAEGGKYTKGTHGSLNGRTVHRPEQINAELVARKGQLSHSEGDLLLPLTCQAGWAHLARDESGEGGEDH